MRLLRTLHAYAGLILGMLLAMYGISGGVLVFKEDLWRFKYPALQVETAVADSTRQAAALENIDRELDGRYTAVMLPDKELPAYHVYTASGEALFAQATALPIEQWRWHESLTGIMTELHFHLAAGQPGKKAGGVIAILAILMAISGIYLWWPVRRSFRLDSLKPHSTKRIALIRLHRDLGSLTAVSLVLFSVTAVGIIFSSSTRAVLNTVLSVSEPTVMSVASSQAEGVRRTPAVAQIDAAKRVFPDARLVAWYPAKSSRPYHYFRFKLPGEPHPNGRSAVYVDLSTDRVLQSINATRQPLGERAWHWFYPLHAGKIGGRPYTLFTLLSAAAITVLGISGLWAYLRRRRIGAT